MTRLYGLKPDYAGQFSSLRSELLVDTDLDVRTACASVIQKVTYAYLAVPIRTCCSPIVAEACVKAIREAFGSQKRPGTHLNHEYMVVALELKLDQKVLNGRPIAIVEVALRLGDLFGHDVKVYFDTIKRRMRKLRKRGDLRSELQLVAERRLDLTPPARRSC